MSSDDPTFVLMLTEQERTRLRELEAVIQRGLEMFIAVAKALEEIRHSRLYRQSYPSFEAYVRDRWAISLSRANQMILSMKAAQNLIEAGTLTQAQAAASPETLFRPLSRVTPELATLTFELVRRIEAEPDAALVSKVVSRVREAIAQGWKERGTGGNSDGSSSTRNTRNSGQLQSFVRLAGRLNSCDPSAIATGDDEVCLRHHLRAARQMLEFCGRLVVALESRLAQQPPSPCIAALPAK